MKSATIKKQAARLGREDPLDLRATLQSNHGGGVTASTAASKENAPCALQARIGEETGPAHPRRIRESSLTGDAAREHVDPYTRLDYQTRRSRHYRIITRFRGQ